MNTHPLGILRTAAIEDGPGGPGGHSGRARRRIPGVKVRNDGVHAAVLVAGNVYDLAYDGVGWQLTPEGERPHAYLVNDALQPIGELTLTHGVLALLRDRRYMVVQDATGAWGVHEHVPAMS